jgi:hypothetical protein
MKRIGNLVAACRPEIILFTVIITIFLTPTVSMAKNGNGKKSGITSNSISIPEQEIISTRSVIVETNRWKPGRCMWIARRDVAQRPEVNIIFPFNELFQAVCHILVGVSDSHICYIHLTPLTSFFRQDTTELVKILENLKGVSTKGEKWSFKVYYFDDNGREQKFRDMIAKSLRNHKLEFSALTPEGYGRGELNLVLSDRKLSYSVKDLRILALEDVSSTGSFNMIPIEAIE